MPLSYSVLNRGLNVGKALAAFAFVAGVGYGISEKQPVGAVLAMSGATLFASCSVAKLTVNSRRRRAPSIERG